MAFVFTPILFILLIIFVAYPFLSDTAQRALRERRESEWQAMDKRKEDAIDALKDIDMDYRMGKLSDEDYEILRAQHEQEAVEVLKEIDALEKKRSKKKS